jgi:hypothetical protein
MPVFAALLILGAALTASADGPPATAIGLPDPVAGWYSAMSQGVQDGQEILSDSPPLPIAGRDRALGQMRFLPITHPWGTPSAILWVPGPSGVHAISTGLDPLRAAVVQVGSGGGSLNGATAMTLALHFRLNADLCFGGALPKAELDGQLVRLPPGAVLGIRGRGANGKAPRVPFLELRCKDPQGKATWTVYVAEANHAIPLGRWTTLVAAWNASVVSDPNIPWARMWLNGKEITLRREKDPLPAGARCPVEGPITVGGDRGFGNVAMAMESFWLFDAALTGPQVTAFLAQEPKWQRPAAAPSTSSGPSPATSSGPSFEPHPELNHPGAWRGEDPSITVRNTTAPGGAMIVNVAKESFGKPVALLLARPLPLAGAKWVNLWHLVEPRRLQYGYDVQAIFQGADGKESYEAIAGGLDSHIGVPNSRACGLWKYVSVKTPRTTEGVCLKGLRITVKAPASASQGGELYFRDLGLERIDYRQTSLYYVVGGFRDNFACVAFNACGARALSNFDGGDTSFVLLDDLIDWAKQGRPQRVNLCLSVYDSQDRLVYESRQKDLPSAAVTDACRRIDIPIAAPDTYRIQGKSYDASTGAYFTTDWAQLIVLKGPPARPAALREALSLAINADKPFGRLEPDAPKTISFDLAVRDWPYPVELRYTVVPYSVFTPGWSANRPLQFDHKAAVDKPGRVDVPYEPRHSVELVVAEIWKANVCLDRQERPIGIRNDMDKAPARHAEVPSLADITAGNGIWVNSTIHALQEGAADYFRANMAEIKKISPISGFPLDVGRVEPLPGVYDWDWLDSIFDAAAREGGRLLPYMAEKWPTEWMPIEFITHADSSVHHGSLMYSYMVAKHNYCTGLRGPEALKQFNQAFARRYLNHPGLAGYYFENEHFEDYFSSHDVGNRKRFADFLKDKYGSLERLNEAWGTACTDWGQVAAPVRNPELTSRKLLADFTRFREWYLDRFVLDCQFDAARGEDPRRPIMIYHSVTSRDALKHIVQGGGMVANGGVHADMGSLLFRETYAAIGGLLERMEPHGVWEYQPIPFGYDEMVFGMLPMGGRGLNFQVFLPAQPFNYEQFKDPNHRQSFAASNARTGYDRILKSMPVLKELRPTEKVYDSVGILAARSSAEVFGIPSRSDLWQLAPSLIARNHYGPRICYPQGELARLNDCKILFLVGDVVTAEQTEYLRKYLAKGGHVVMNRDNGRYCLDDPDKAAGNYVLAQVGIDPDTSGTSLPGIVAPHDIHTVGKGQVLLFQYEVHPNFLDKAIPALMAWAGVMERLADCDDPDMLLHVLAAGDVYYLASDHTVGHHDNYQESNWSGKIRFCKPLPPGKYQVTDIWNDTEVGVLTPEQLAAGFEAGLYHNKQMKIFRIRRAP